MEDLSRIRARLDSLTELGELVGALRSMAASRTREAQEAFAGTRAYRQVIEQAISEVWPMVPAETAPPAGNGDGTRVLLVIASENGFVGLFNSRLIDRALEIRQPGEPLILVGRRGQTVAAERGVTDATGFAMTSRIHGVTTLARRIAARLTDVAAARIVYARHRPGDDTGIEVRDVLPYDTIVDPEARTPLVHLAPRDLLNRLTGEYLFAEIAHALMESLASENAARMRAMDAASRNIGDRVGTLARDERIARQEQTTTEMLDVVTGAEAVNHS